MPDGEERIWIFGFSGRTMALGFSCSGKPRPVLDSLKAKSEKFGRTASSGIVEE